MFVMTVGLEGFVSCRKLVLAVVWYERVQGYLTLEGQVEVGYWVKGMGRGILCCLVVASVSVGHRLPPKTSEVADRWRIDDFEALALALRYIVAGR